MLRSGNPGNVGRPRTFIRDAAALAFHERIPFLTGVIDGVMVERRYQPEGAAEPIIVRASADVGDRIAAMRELRTVGLPTSGEVTIEAVQERLAETVRIIRDSLPETDAEALLTRIEEAWT